MTIFLTAYDDRKSPPSHLPHFIEQTLRYSNLNLIVPSILCLEKHTAFVGSKKNELILIGIESLPFWKETELLFRELFANYSTNRPEFEKSCFDRWFAINIATNHLEPDDFVCQIDSDFLIGTRPSEIVSACRKIAEDDIEIVAEWVNEPCRVISPAIIFIKKKTLFLFCEYVLAEYYSPNNRSFRIKEYFSRIGNGLPGGVCDMRALGCFVDATKCRAFNLSKLTDFNVIGNLTAFRNANQAAGADWTLTNGMANQFLRLCEDEKRLIGIHCQGNAKVLIKQLVEDGLLTEGLCQVCELDSCVRPPLRMRLARKIKALFLAMTRVLAR